MCDVFVPVRSCDTAPTCQHLHTVVTVAVATVLVFFQEVFGGSLDHPVPADPLSLCRILVAVTEILDVPRAFLEEAAARSRSLQLGYELLGQREMVRLENPVAKDVSKTPGGRGAIGAEAERRNAGERGGGERSEGRRGEREEEGGLLVPISVNHFRYMTASFTTPPNIYVVFTPLKAPEQTDP